jgi:hypothetical protein
VAVELFGVGDGAFDGPFKVTSRKPTLDDHTARPFDVQRLELVDGHNPRRTPTHLRSSMAQRTGTFITKLPKADHDTDEWRAAMQALLLVAEPCGNAAFLPAMSLKPIAIRF